MKWEIPFIDNQVTGVELIINPDGNFTYNYLVLNKKKQKLVTKISGTAINDLVTLIALLDVKSPLLLSINGKGIISKKVNRIEGENLDALITKVIPNSNVEDFYIQAFEVEGNSCFATVVRRSVIDNIVNSLRAKGFELIKVVLGPFAVQSALSLLLNIGENAAELKFSRHEIICRGGNISDYLQITEEAEKIIKNSDFEIKSTSLIAFSTALAYFNPPVELNSNITAISEAAEEFSNKMKFKKAAVLILASLFTILFINFIVFSYLSDIVKTKSGAFLLSSSELILVDSLKRQVDERSAFLNKSGLAQPSRNSLYADEIAKDMPEEILLTSINIQPLKKNDEDTKKKQFENKKIMIAGQSKNALEVNGWIKTLRSKDWISSITLENYRQKEGNGVGEFIIEIKLK